MPGMPIFQDSPSQLKGQIYVQDSVTSNVVPLKVDTTGNLPISGSVGLATGAEVALASGTTVGLATGAEVALASGTTVGLATGAEVALASGATVGLAAGTNAIGNVGLSAGTNLIGKVENQLVFTNLDAFGAATPLQSQPVGATATVNATSRNISLESSYNWFIKNTGTAANQNITLKVELSPDGTNWLEDTGTTITVAFGASKMITVTNFLQYARFVITGGAAATTVISSFQAQH